MKKLVFVLIYFLSAAVYALPGNKKLEIGDKAVLTEVKMTDVSGERISLADVKKGNGILVLFSCNQCPFVLRWEGRYNDIKAWADKNNVGMIVLNSNYQKRDGDDSFEAMQKKAKEKGYNFYYVVDKESQIANAFGGQTTPHVFLFDGNWKLAYKGAIDDSYESANNVKQAYLKDAIKSLGSGEEVALTETKPVGCGIKRKVD
uniref:redoxin domain-containing protein n=1 Tax=uncultured Draconibacterium sp. TaxID=1573823 RepID=UPI0032166647